MSESCAQCKYHRPTETPAVVSCRRYQPSDGFRAWPNVLATDWCGTFEQQDGEREYAGGKVGFAPVPFEAPRVVCDARDLAVLGVSTFDYGTGAVED